MSGASFSKHAKTIVSYGCRPFPSSMSVMTSCTFRSWSINGYFLPLSSMPRKFAPNRQLARTNSLNFTGCSGTRLSSGSLEAPAFQGKTCSWLKLS